MREKEDTQGIDPECHIRPCDENSLGGPVRKEFILKRRFEIAGGVRAIGFRRCAGQSFSREKRPETGERFNRPVAKGSGQRTKRGDNGGRKNCGARRKKKKRNASFRPFVKAE